MNRYVYVVVSVIAGFALATALVLGTLYEYFSDVQKQQLKLETEMAALAVAAQQETYLQQMPKGNFRVTWILPNGAVAYDSDGSSEEMENHLSREEVRQAISSGYGESQRYSATMTERMLYSAKRLPDGSVLRLSMPQRTIFRVILDMGLPVGCILLLVTAAAAIFSSRQTKKANQEETETMRREFTANVSHELKSPLHAISGYAELLKNGMVMEQDTGYFAEKIYNEIQRMIRLVQDIIVLSRLDEGKENTTKAKVNLYQLAQGVLNELEPMADNRGIRMELIGHDEIVEGIPQLLRGMMYNLCENAIKYNRDEGQVIAEVTKVSGHVQFSVRDTGVGIPQKDLPRIFERFYRADKSHSKEIGGTGLGLSIVKHAVRLHGAKIEVDSLEGEGTVFTVKF